MKEKEKRPPGDKAAKGGRGGPGDRVHLTSQQLALLRRLGQGPPEQARTTNDEKRAGSAGGGFYLVLSPDESALLRAITESRQSSESTSDDAPPRRRSGMIKLAPAEMDLVRRLGSISAARGHSAPPASGARRRTADVVLSHEQAALLRRLADAVADQWPDPTSRGPSAGVSVRDLLLTVHELAFLSRLAGRRTKKPRSDAAPPPRLAARLANVEADIATAAVGLVPIAVTRDEAKWLDEQTNDVYGYILPEERRARLILREKIHRALEELS